MFQKQYQIKWVIKSIVYGPDGPYEAKDTAEDYRKQKLIENKTIERIWIELIEPDPAQYYGIEESD